jgi:hypothetical protein
LFGEINTLLNTHNIFGFGGQTHSITQRLKMLIYIPLLFINKSMGWINPAILLTQLKYLFVFTAYAYFNTDYYKTQHPELYKYFTNDPSSMGFQSTISLTLFVLMMFAVIGSIGAQISDTMPYFYVVLVFFQFYAFFSQIGTYNMIKNFGFYDAQGHFNFYVL